MTVDNKNFALALTGSGAALQSFGSYAAGGANAAIARRNAAITEQQARVRLAQAGFDIQKINREKARVIAGQRTSFAGQGVALGEGTPLALQQDTERQAMLDVLATENNAYLEALGLRRQAQAYKYESKLARRGGAFNALGQLGAGGADYYKILAGLDDE